MPRKKKSKKLSVDKIEEIASYEPPKSYRSLLYGVLTVIAIFLIAFIGLRAFSVTSNPSIGENGISTENISETYVVKAGDSLWSIAESQYKDGYKWVEIAKANNLSNAGDIEQGMRLVLPEIKAELVVKAPTISITIAQPSATPAPSEKPKSTNTPTSSPSEKPKPTQAPSVATTPGKISEKTYTVVRGDNLWDIAVRAYGDGYKWVEIAKANNLANPDLIHAGNKFILPR